MNTLTRALSIAMFLAGPAHALDVPPAGEYAYSFPLELQGDMEYFRLDVPLEVYQSVADTSMRDAGVYNALGQAVPRIFKRPESVNEDPETSLALNLVPLNGLEPDELSRLRLALRQVDGDTTLELDTGKAPDRNPASPLVAYIIDVRELDATLKALTFTWPPVGQGFIGKIRADGSHDLEHWRSLGSATVADLEYGETRIEQNRLDLHRSAYDFIRITWRDMPEGWRLEGVSGIHADKRPPARRDWLILESSGAGETGRDFIFDARGFPPVDRVDVELPDDNVVVRASILYRLDREETWRSVHTGVFYNVSRQGNSLRSSPAGIGAVRARKWMVRIQSGTTAGPVRLKLGWRPDTLLFLAQGEPPFELAAGRALDSQDSFPHDRVLADRAIFDMLEDSGQAGVATLGARTVRSGPESLEIAPRKTWRVTLLWAGLVAAVLLVGWLVWSLMREMREESAR